MLSKSARESHRARSLCLSSQNRSRYARAANGHSIGSAVAAVPRSRHHPGQGKGSAIDGVVLEDEVMLAREEMMMAQDDDEAARSGCVSSAEDAAAAAASPHGGGIFSVGAIEVPLCDLIQVKRHNKHPSMDFEFVPRHKAVIALDDSLLERRTYPTPVSSSSSSTASEGENGDEEEDWEILVDDDFDENAEKKMTKIGYKKDKAATKSWASIVSRNY